MWCLETFCLVDVPDRANILIGKFVLAKIRLGEEQRTMKRTTFIQGKKGVRQRNSISSLGWLGHILYHYCCKWIFALIWAFCTSAIDGSYMWPYSMFFKLISWCKTVSTGVQVVSMFVSQPANKSSKIDMEEDIGNRKSCRIVLLLTNYSSLIAKSSANYHTSHPTGLSIFCTVILVN